MVIICLLFVPEVTDLTALMKLEVTITPDPKLLSRPREIPIKYNARPINGASREVLAPRDVIGTTEGWSGLGRTGWSAWVALSADIVLIRWLVIKEVLLYPILNIGRVRVDPEEKWL